MASFFEKLTLSLIKAGAVAAKNGLESLEKDAKQVIADKKAQLELVAYLAGEGEKLQEEQEREVKPEH